MERIDASQSELMKDFRSYKDKTEGNFAELPKLKDHFSKKQKEKYDITLLLAVPLVT